MASEVCGMNTSTFLNPVLAGDYADPSIVRVGGDFYLVHSSNKYVPGLVIWHSRDLVNWRPIGAGLPRFHGDVWAPELVHHENRFYIYYPQHGENFVITADRIEGPWSEPIDLRVKGIDPGHVVGPDGRRYLHLDDGYVVDLALDGLSVVSARRKDYDGWIYPSEWKTEGFCLESPKLIRRGDYYYLTVAEGGTAGPPTSHMVVSARSHHPDGPWENSPHNPIVHTYSQEETWWSRGHGTLIDTPSGEWWIVYHAYRKDYPALGRHTLIEPVEWTDDGWFRIPHGVRPDRPIARPLAEESPATEPLSDRFEGSSLRLQWRAWGEADLSRYRVGDGRLTVAPQESSVEGPAPLVCSPRHPVYEAEVDVSLTGGGNAAFLLFYDPQTYAGIEFSDGGPRMVVAGRVSAASKFAARTARLRIWTDHRSARFSFRGNGGSWKDLGECDVSTYHHHKRGGFVSLRLGFVARGETPSMFSQFLYRGLREIV